MHEFNTLHESEIYTLSTDPLIGVLEVVTDQGSIELAVNKDGAESLIATLLEFLAEGEERAATTNSTAAPPAFAPKISAWLIPTICHGRNSPTATNR